MFDKAAMGKRWNGFGILAVCGEKALANYVLLKHIWEVQKLSYW